MKEVLKCLSPFQWILTLVFFCACAPKFGKIDHSDEANENHAKLFFSVAPATSLSADSSLALVVDASQNRVDKYQQLKTGNKGSETALPCYYHISGPVPKVGKYAVWFSVTEVDYIQFKKVAFDYVWVKGQSADARKKEKVQCDKAAQDRWAMENIVLIKNPSIPLLGFTKDSLLIAEPDCDGVVLGCNGQRSKLEQTATRLMAVEPDQIPFDRAATSPIPELGSVD